MSASIEAMNGRGGLDLEEMSIDEALALLDEIELGIYRKYGVEGRRGLTELVSRGMYRYEDIFLDLARLDFIDYIRRSLLEEREGAGNTLGVIGAKITEMLPRLLNILAIITTNPLIGLAAALMLIQALLP